MLYQKLFWSFFFENPQSNGNIWPTKHAISSYKNLLNLKLFRTFLVLYLHEKLEKEFEVMKNN